MGFLVWRSVRCNENEIYRWERQVLPFLFEWNQTRLKWYWNRIKSTFEWFVSTQTNPTRNTRIPSPPFESHPFIVIQQTHYSTYLHPFSFISPLPREPVSIGEKIPPRDTQEARKNYCTTRPSSAVPPTPLSAPPTDQFRTKADSHPPTQWTIEPTGTAPNRTNTRSADCGMSRGLHTRGKLHRTHRLRCDRGLESKERSKLCPYLTWREHRASTQNIAKQGPRSDCHCGVAEIEGSYEIHNTSGTENMADIHYMRSLGEKRTNGFVLKQRRNGTVDSC